MKLTIDRFEGEYAVCEKENRAMINILRINLPAETKEGDVIIKAGDSYVLDKEETQKKKAELKTLINDLWK